MGVLFAIGSLCFAIGAMPLYAEWVDVTIDGLTFFVGSIFFTTAALLQLLETTRDGDEDRHVGVRNPVRRNAVLQRHDVLRAEHELERDRG